MSTILAGDIGGTKVDLALYDPAQGPARPLAQRSFRTGEVDGLAAPVNAFLREVGLPVTRCAFGAPGPVVDGVAVGVNVPWPVEEVALTLALGAPVTLLNDLQAVAYGVPHLGPADRIALHGGRPDPHGAIAILAPGTGLGEGYLAWDAGGYMPHPSEGGHADFAPTDARQGRLLAHLLTRYEHVSYERVCSGMGFPDLYRFMRDVEGLPEPAWLTEELVSATDLTPVVVRAAQDAARPCPLARTTLELFVDILGAEAGNLGLRYVATGGVYLGGGMPAHMLPALRDGRLLRAFLAKGRLRFLMDEVPLYIITRPQLGLYGAACFALAGA